MDKSLLIILLVVAGLALFFFMRSKSSASTMSPETLKEQVEEVPGIVIDVRTPGEFGDGHLKITDHNFNLLSGEFEQKLDSLDKNQTYYLYCRTGNRSGQAASIMKNNGFENVHNIGGYKQLVNAGFESSR